MLAERILSLALIRRKQAASAGMGILLKTKLKFHFALWDLRDEFITRICLSHHGMLFLIFPEICCDANTFEMKNQLTQHVTRELPHINHEKEKW